MTTIYMISEDGATIAPNMPAVIAVFEKNGFRKCTKEEYEAKLRKLARKDTKAAKDKDND